MVVDLFEKMTFEQRPGGGKGRSHTEVGQARCIEAGQARCTEAGQARCIWENFRRPVCPEWVGKEEMRSKGNRGLDDTELCRS